MDTMISNYREYAGNLHFMSCLQREYRFEVQVFKENEDGSRELVRVENPYA